MNLVYQQDESGAWIVHVAEEPAAHTYGRTLAGARRRIHEVLPLFWENPEALDWQEDIRLPRPVQRTLEAALKARRRANDAQTDADRLTRAATERLAELGLPMRDIGSLLGLSHQRIGQLAKTSALASSAPVAAAS